MKRRDSEPDRFDPSRAREDYVYQGYKNSLMYLRRFYAEYHCTFNLRFFPFDEQVCKMEFKARTVTRYVFISFIYMFQNRDCSGKFANGLNIQITIVQKPYE